MMSYAGNGTTTEHVFVASGPGSGSCCDSVYELYYSGSAWYTTNLSSKTNAYAMGGTGLAGFWDGNEGAEKVAYIGSDTNLHMYQFVTGYNQWGDSPDPSSFAFPSGSNSLAAFIDQYGEHFYYVNSNQHLYESLLSYTNGLWYNNDLTAQTGTLVNLGTRLTGFPNGAYDLHVYFLSGNNLDEFHESDPNPWSVNYLTTEGGSGTAALNSFVYR